LHRSIAPFLRYRTTESQPFVGKLSPSPGPASYLPALSQILQLGWLSGSTRRHFAQHGSRAFTYRRDCMPPPPLFHSHVSLVTNSRISVDFAGKYVEFHVEIHIFLQRIGVLSPWKLPSPLFFIPFTSSSLIHAPAPPVDFSAGSLLQWFGAAVINTSPLLAYALWRRAWLWLRLRTIGEIYYRLPLPEGFPEYRARPGPPADSFPEPTLPPTNMQQSSQAVVTEAAADTERPTTQDREPEPTTQSSGEGGTDSVPQSQPAPEGTGPPQPGHAPTTIRRRSSTFSGRGDEFGSDEEDGDAISGPLISFDVETTDAPDAQPGIWFTELRPTISTDANLPPPAPFSTGLTRQPIQHASLILGTFVTYQLLAPVETWALRFLTRSFLVHRSLPADYVFDTSFSISNWSLRWVTNYLVVNSLSLGLQTLLWMVVVRKGRSLHLTPEQWSCVPVQQQAELA
jgi:hypothetical protein